MKEIEPTERNLRWKNNAKKEVVEAGYKAEEMFPFLEWRECIISYAVGIMDDEGFGYVGEKDGIEICVYRKMGT